MRRKIRYDEECEKFCKIFLELNKALNRMVFLSCNDSVFLISFDIW